MNSAFIRNCNLILKCPAYWDELGPTDQEGVRYCSSRERKVFMCNAQEELRVRIEQNVCVAVHPPRAPNPVELQQADAGSAVAAPRLGLLG